MLMFFIARSFTSLFQCSLLVVSMQNNYPHYIACKFVVIVCTLFFCALSNWFMCKIFVWHKCFHCKDLGDRLLLNSTILEIGFHCSVIEQRIHTFVIISWTKYKYGESKSVRDGEWERGDWQFVTLNECWIFVRIFFCYFQRNLVDG